MVGVEKDRGGSGGGGRTALAHQKRLPSLTRGGQRNLDPLPEKNVSRGNRRAPPQRGGSGSQLPLLIGIERGRILTADDTFPVTVFVGAVDDCVRSRIQFVGEGEQSRSGRVIAQASGLIASPSGGFPQFRHAHQWGPRRHSLSISTSGSPFSGRTPRSRWRYVNARDRASSRRGPWKGTRCHRWPRRRRYPQCTAFARKQATLDRGVVRAGSDPRRTPRRPRLGCRDDDGGRRSRV